MSTEQAGANKPRRDILPPEKRRERIVAELLSNGYVKVRRLAELLDVSEVTIRSDLDVVERQHPMNRVHGGATLVTRHPQEPAFEEALEHGADAKRRIGVAAAGLIESGDTIILDVGTTTTAVAVALAERQDLRDVLVITNSLTIALTLESSIPRLTVIVTGGTLRPLQHSLVSPYATRVLEDLRADMAFIGCTGLDPVNGVTNVNLPETELKRAMLTAAARTVIVADSSKFGRTDRGRIGPLDEVWTLVTEALPADAERYRDLPSNILIAP